MPRPTSGHYSGAIAVNQGNFKPPRTNPVICIFKFWEKGNDGIKVYRHDCVVGWGSKTLSILHN